MAEENNDYLAKLLRGDVPLVITFWGHFVGVGFVLSTLLPFASYTAINIFPRWQPELELLVFAGIGGLFVYYPFISIALYRSAKKYQGRALWRILAKVIAVILGLFVIVFFIAPLGIAILYILTFLTYGKWNP